MILSEETLRAVLIGAVDMARVGPAFRAVRMPAAIAPLYRPVEGLATRMDCPAGVRLRFRTDSAFVNLALHYDGRFARANGRGAVVVDGGLPGQGFGSAAPAGHWRGQVFHQDAPRHRLIDIWLPHMSVADVGEVEVQDGCDVSPAPLALRWLALGDSITQGMESSLPTLCHVARCALAIDAEAFNLGVGGATMRAELALAARALPADIISIAYGTNDFLTDVPPREFAQAAEELLRETLAANASAPILLMTPLSAPGRREPNHLGAKLQDYRDALGPLAGMSPRIALVDGTELLPDDSAMFADGLHPNDAGFVTYTRNLLGHMREAMVTA